MALTKVDKSVSSTPGIVDNSDATAITIDSSERVGIGTSTLHKNLNIHTSDSNSTNIVFTNSTTGTGSNDGFYIGIDSNESPEFWNYENTDFIVGLNNSEKFRIKADGNVGIGTTSPNHALSVGSTSVATSIISVVGSSSGFPQIRFSDDTSESGQGRVFYDSANDAMGFSTSGSERMRIDSSGILMKGKTTAGATSTEGFEISNNGLNQYSTQTSGAVTSTMHVLYGSTFKYYVGYDGQVYATNTSITSLSDERLKENVKDLDTGLNDILELKPKRFDWKEGEGTGGKNISGFIAQDVEDTNFSDLVGNFKHNSLDDCKSFQYSGLIPSLVKAIQEQQEIIDDLKARIEVLEA